jgi:hypothetical protein
LTRDEHRIRDRYATAANIVTALAKTARAAIAHGADAFVDDAADQARHRHDFDGAISRHVAP